MPEYRAIKGTNALIEEDQYKAVAEKWRAGEFSDWSFDLKFRSKELSESASGAGNPAVGAAYGGVVAPDYSLGLVAAAQRPLIVAQLFHPETTSSNLVRVIKTTEETEEHGDTGTAEGASYDFYDSTAGPHDYTMVSTTAAMPVTEDFLMDVPSAMPYLAKRLQYLVGKAEERKMVYGNGVVPNMMGLVNADDTDESAQFESQGADTIDTAVAKLMAKVFSASGMLPTWVLMNPLRWLTYATTQASGGEFLTGYANSDHVFQLWGMQIAMSGAVSQDTIVVGNPLACGRWVHTSGVKVESSTGYANYFGEGKVLVRAKVRTTLAYERPSGIGVLSMGS
jgi:HK97 family phage major capsid protein